MVIDPSREVTPFMEARLEWYEAMEREGEVWRERVRQENQVLLAQLDDNPSKKEENQEK